MIRKLLAPALLAALMIACGAPPPEPAAPATAQPAEPAAAPPAQPAPAPSAEPAAVAPAEPATALPAELANLPPGTYARFTTSMGNFTVHLFDKDAPKTVANFIGLATGKKAWRDPRTQLTVHRPLFNNLTFHRIIPGFMIQGGDPLGDGTGGTGSEFPDEFSPKLRHNKVGIVSMANHGPDTNDSQFFITVSPNLARLDGHYTVFGEVVEGMPVVMAISRVQTGAEDRPVTPVVIKTVKIDTLPGAPAAGGR